MSIQQYVISGIRSLKKDGIKVTLYKVQTVILKKSTLKNLKKSYFISKEVRMQQSRKTLENSITFSIVVPLYNTPINYLKEMIQSVQEQTYSDWELCLADGSEGKLAKSVEQYCREVAKKDTRIKYRRLEKNQGISENTNVALTMAEGEYIGLLDHDDLLHPSALYEVRNAIETEQADFIYTDEATFEKNVKNIIHVHFKPDYGLDTLRANNYICHFSVFKRELLKKVGMFRKEYDGSQDHDMILRLTKEAEKIHHIPKLLYFWRSHPGSVADNINVKSYAIDAGIRAVKNSVESYGEIVKVESSKVFPAIYRLRYQLKKEPFVSIIIICKDKVNVTKQCINSILEKSSYKNFEIVLVDNNSKEEETWKIYKVFQRNSMVQILSWNKEVNLSVMYNFAVKEAKGEVLLFLHNDIKVISESWIEEMLMYAQRKDVGVVGAKLYYEDHSIQHAGMLIGVGKDRIVAYSHHKQPKENIGYMGRLFYAQNVSAVTLACMMVRKEVYEELGGLEENFTLAYNDVDFCMKARERGYAVIFTPYAELYHYESNLRELKDTEESKIKFQKEAKILKERWKKELEKGDPYYNPNFDLDRDDFMIKMKSL